MKKESNHQKLEEIIFKNNKPYANHEEGKIADLIELKKRLEKLDLEISLHTFYMYEKDTKVITYNEKPSVSSHSHSFLLGTDYHEFYIIDPYFSCFYKRDYQEEKPFFSFLPVEYLKKSKEGIGLLNDLILKGYISLNSSNWRLYQRSLQGDAIFLYPKSQKRKG